MNKDMRDRIEKAKEEFSAWYEKINPISILAEERETKEHILKEEENFADRYKNQ